MPDTYTRRQDLEAQLVAKAWKDEEFKQELIRNPKAVLEREVSRLEPGAKVPENLDVRVLEETPDTLYVVLPPKPGAERGELSDEDLDNEEGDAMAEQDLGGSKQAVAGRKGLQGELIARAWNDEAFREELVRNPKAVLQREVSRIKPGLTLPKNLNVKVVEETPTTLNVVLPYKPHGAESGELSDADLERVAGGDRITVDGYWELCDALYGN